MKKITIILSVIATISIGLYVYARTFVNIPIKALSADYKGDLPLDLLKLPEGFAIDVYADQVVNARSMDISPSGVLYVGTRGEGSVYACVDRDNDFHIDTTYTLYSGGNMPNGVAFYKGDLYIAEVNRILMFSDIESKLDNPGKPSIVYDKYPTEAHHGWKYIAFGPDNKLYVPVGAPCNICESDNEIFNTITRINPDGTDFEIVHNGVRNTVGFNWHPSTQELWFTDNGRDMMGDDIPACELNHAPSDYQHFGYPYCHQGNLPDPEFGKKRSCDEFIAPAQNLGPHVAPLGLEFLNNANVPDQMKGKILIAEHGSWNRSTKIGYRISSVDIAEDGSASNYSPFIEGWLQSDGEVWGRPVDLEILKDGSFLISDDYADVIYRVQYTGR